MCGISQLCMHPHLRKIARYCKDSEREKQKTKRSGFNVYGRDRWAKFDVGIIILGSVVVRLCNRVCRFCYGTLGVLKVAHKFCGPVFQSGYILSVIQPWHLVAFKLNFLHELFLYMWLCTAPLPKFDTWWTSCLVNHRFLDLLVAYY